MQKKLWSMLWKQNITTLAKYERAINLCSIKCGIAPGGKNDKEFSWSIGMLAFVAFQK